MSSIRLANVTFAYPQQITLIDSCTLDFGPGWTGIVGRNGDGKSTLLDLIDGTSVPHGGAVDTAGLRMARCAQSAAIAADVEELATAWTGPAMRWMSLLALEPEDFWRWEELSPGMRRRWQLAAALFTEPGALLLDEPTNHLDAEGRRLLVAALRRFAGVGIVVSHDRALLDALCSRTVRVRSGRVTSYPGGYSVARELWRAEEARALAELEAAQAQERALRHELTERSVRHGGAVRSLGTPRSTSVRDHDARSTARKGRAQRAESSLARDKSVTRARLARVQRSLEERDRPASAGGSIFVDPAQCPWPWVLRFEGAVTVADRVLADQIELRVRRDERRWLQGPNGCGKTTLLATALHACALPPDRVLYVPQQLDVGSLRARFDALDPDARRRVLHVGAALTLDVRAVLDQTALSAGEVRKLAVALGFIVEPWLVALDEPTNDLDVESIERLESALVDFPGALLVVTHDETFAARVRASQFAPFTDDGEGMRHEE